MTTAQRRLLILCSLLLLTVVMIWFGPESETDATSSVLNPPLRTVERVSSVHPELLHLPIRTRASMQTNLFAMVVEPEPANTVLPVNTLVNSQQFTPLPFKFIGLFEAGNETMLSVSADDEVYLLKQGEQALGYQLKRIDEQVGKKRAVFYSSALKREDILELGMPE